LHLRRKSAGIFWSGEFNNQHGIGSAKLDGTGVNQSFIAAPDVSNIAVGGNYLYWVNGSSGTIGRANLDGSGVNPNLITGAKASRLAKAACRQCGDLDAPSVVTRQALAARSKWPSSRVFSIRQHVRVRRLLFSLYLAEEVP
jgi:hypothetical protein